MRRIACRRCGTVKRERLDFLADNPRFTKRFAFYVGRRCAQASIRDVAKELKLDWDTVKTLEMQYMRAQIARAGTPGPDVVTGSSPFREARRSRPAAAVGGWGAEAACPHPTSRDQGRGSRPAAVSPRRGPC